MKNNPLVTVNILSFNRKDELRITLTKVFEQDYKNIEVIVVDNASSDGTQEMVKNEFPEVKLIGLKENIGIAGWNKGFEAAKGEYVLVLDDDSYPGKGTIEGGVHLMSVESKAVVIGFTIYNTNFNLIENRQEYIESKGEISEPLGFIGCGALIRRRIFLDLEGFESAIFLYYNELEFSIRAKNNGYKILFDPNHVVLHTYSLNQRNKVKAEKLLINERRFENTFKSYFLYQYLHFEIKYFLKYSVKLVLSKLYIALRLGFLFTYFKTFFSLFFLAYIVRNKRKPVKESIQKEYNFGNLKFKDLYAYYSD